MEELHQKVFKYLVQCGMSPKHLGFRYAFDAIIICLEKDYIQSFEQEIYGIIADNNHKSISSVIKSLKNAMDFALLRCNNPKNPILLLQDEKSGSVKCGEFIASSARLIPYFE